LKDPHRRHAVPQAEEHDRVEQIERTDHEAAGHYAFHRVAA
jgi:hypothetical protein